MRYTLLAFLCAITVVAYVQRSALGVPSKTIEAELGISTTEMGLAWTAFYAGYAALQLPSGWLADRLGSKPVLVLFAVLWSAMTGAVGLATGLTGLLFLWGLMGGAQAGVFPCSTKAIGATFPRTAQASASGALICCMSLGAFLAPVLTARLLGPLTWQQIFAVYAVPGLVWAVAFALVVPRPDVPAAPEAPSTPPPAATAPVRWSRLVTDPQMLLLCGQQFFRSAGQAFFYTWFPRFLQEVWHLTEQEAGALAGWPSFVGMFSALLGGAVSDWLLRRTGNPRLSRQGLAVAALVACSGTAMAAYFATSPAAVVILLCATVFCGMVAGVGGYATAIALGGKRVGTVFATMNMSGNAGAALFPFAVGLLVQYTGNWNNVLFLLAGLWTASAVCWARLNPKGTVFDEEPT